MIRDVRWRDGGVKIGFDVSNSVVGRGSDSRHVVSARSDCLE
jgi:hypothetical protein